MSPVRPFLLVTAQGLAGSEPFQGLLRQACS
jgi:hypothetical protein